ncbi:porphobilinogen synthase [Ekhidna sp.]|uniref:porphobilinogen synthase n=1 Tax=Ekhidna sp. TaxID=2608089 RepID=UPI003B512B03
MRRPRRNRASAALRDLAQETTLTTNDFIFPLFLLEGSKKKSEVESMPGIFRLSEDLILKEIEECLKMGIKGFDVFPVVEEKYKDKTATKSYDPDFFYLKTLTKIKKEFPEALIITDVAMDPYSSDGHDGIVEDGRILNDETLDILGQMALAQAETGIDMIGPSDMMDFRVGYLRNVLDEQGYINTGILSYTAKYASSFYGPFRDALDSAPKFGDKKTYQMNPANSDEAIIEAELDFNEGADVLMVKPALAYLDIIQRLKSSFNIPIAAYNVSGEYAMIKAAGEKGWLDAEKAMMESLLSIKRAGADMILTYFAKEAAVHLDH